MENIITVSGTFPLEIEGVFYHTYYWYVEVEIVLPEYKPKKPRVMLECPEQDILEEFPTIHAMNTYAKKKILPQT